MPQAAEFMFGQSPVQRQVLHQDVYQHLIEMISSWQSGWDLWKSPTFEQGISCQSFYICYWWSNIDHNTHDKDNKDKEDSHDEDADNDRAPLDLHCSIFQWLIHHQLSRQEIRATNRMHLHGGQEHAADMSCKMGTLIHDTWITWEFIANRFLKGSLGQTSGSFIIYDESGIVRTNTWITFA